MQFGLLLLMALHDFVVLTFGRYKAFAFITMRPSFACVIFIGIMLVIPTSDVLQGWLAAVYTRSRPDVFDGRLLY